MGKHKRKKKSTNVGSKSSTSVATSRMTSGDSVESSKMKSEDNIWSSRMTLGDSVESSRMTSEDNIGSSRMTSGNSLESSRMTSGDSLESSKMKSEDSLESSRMTSEDNIESSRMTSEDYLESSRMTSEDYLESSRMTSGDSLESSKMKSEDSLESSRMTSEDNIESSRMTSEDNLESSRMTSEDNLESSRMTSGDNIEPSEDNIESSRMTSEDNLESSRMTSEDNLESSRMTSEDNLESSRMTLEDNLESSRMTSQDNLESSRMTSEDNIEPSEDNIESSRMTSEDNLESSRMTSEDNLESSRMTSEDNLESLRMTLEDNLESSRMTSQDNLESSRMTSEDNIEPSEDNIESSRMTSEDNLESPKMKSEDCLESSRMTSEDNFESSRMTSKYCLESSRMKSEDCLESSRMTSEDSLESLRMTSEDNLKSSSRTSSASSDLHRHSLPLVLVPFEGDAQDRSSSQPRLFGVCRIQPVNIRPLSMPSSKSHDPKSSSVKDDVLSPPTDLNPSPGAPEGSPLITTNKNGVGGISGSQSQTSAGTPSGDQLVSGSLHLVKDEIGPLKLVQPHCLSIPTKGRGDLGGVVLGASTEGLTQIDSESMSVDMRENDSSRTSVCENVHNSQDQPDFIGRPSGVISDDVAQNSFDDVQDISCDGEGLAVILEEDYASLEQTKVIELCDEDDIPFIDDDEEIIDEGVDFEGEVVKVVDSKDEGEMDDSPPTVELRRRPLESVPKGKRHAEMVFPVLRTTVTKKMADSSGVPGGGCKVGERITIEGNADVEVKDNGARVENVGGDVVESGGRGVEYGGGGVGNGGDEVENYGDVVESGGGEVKNGGVDVQNDDDVVKSGVDEIKDGVGVGNGGDGVGNDGVDVKNDDDVVKSGIGEVNEGGVGVENVGDRRERENVGDEIEREGDVGKCNDDGEDTIDDDIQSGSDVVHENDGIGKSNENIAIENKSNRVEIEIREIERVGNNEVKKIIKECRGDEPLQESPNPPLDEDALQAFVHHLLERKTTSSDAADIMSVERRGTKALELWAKRATDGYAGVNISNMTTDWRNGLAFCALIHHFKPDLIDFSSLKPENILENNALAFRVAEQQLGIPALLDAEDMVECDIPDRLSVLTYVAQYYQVFASLGLTSPKRVVNNTSPTPSSPAGIKKTKLTPIPPQPKTKTEIKTDKVSGGGRLRREVCVKCSNPVFLAERLLVGSPGQLMHRTCFRCARCTTQLTLASYYETEKGQFCCETCPDEEITVSPENANSLVTSSSPKLSRRMSTSDSESEYDTDGSDNESDGYSNTVELALEDKTKNSDARSDTSAHSPKLTPGPPKPRTVFLSKTLESGSNDSLNEHKETQSTVDKDEQQFSKVSPALFGSRANDVGTTKASDSGLDHCDDAKGLITDPPDKLTLDTGQDDNSNHATDYSKETPSSIVAQRLKMFREISNKSSSSNIKTNVLYNKPYCKENDVRLQNSDKDSSLQLKVTEAGPCSTTTNEDKVTDKIDKEILHEEITIPKVPVHESVKGIDEDKLSKGEETSVKNDSILQEEKIEIKTNEKIVVTSNIPSITISVEEKNNDELQKETKETQDVLPTTKESTITTSEMTVSKESSSSEANPFDLEDESQLDESGIHNQSQGGGSDKDVNIASSLSKDSGAELSSASLHSVQYPEDLNPFGSDEEDDDVKGAASISQNDKSEASEKVDDTASKVDDTPSKVDDTPKKKLIKVSLNPFDSDEDEDFDEKDSKSDSKKDKSESKNLNPFWSDDEEPSDSTQSTPTKSKIKPPRPPPPTLARNSTPSYLNQMRDATPSPKRNSQEGRKGSATLSPARELFPQPKSSPGLSQKGLPPSLPTPKVPSSPSSPSASVALKRKGRRAPAPPPQPFSPRDGASSSESTADTMSMDAMSLSSLGTQSQATVGNEDDGQDEVLSRKLQKDMKNHSNKMNGTTEQRVPPPKPARVQQALGDMSGSKGVIRRPSMSKSEAGEWQRKKGPAPPRPVPQKRSVKKMPMRLIQQELHDIEVKQTELERQGVLLETSIRKRTESTPNNPLEDPGLHNSGPSSIEVEDMIMQLFELVNEKNELFRRQTELMYLKREKRLEEEYVDLEYQIRCLMLKLPTEKTEIDTAQEEELIARLVKVVEQRDEIINCLELDRLREAQEDESIATHMMQYQEKHIDGVGIGNGSTLQNTAKKKKTLKLPRKKKKKEKKDKKGAKADADKDIDETEVKETKKKKKKWLF